MPRNAGRVVCGNCETPFLFKDYEESYEARSAWEAAVASLDAAVKSAEDVEEAAANHRDKAKLEARNTVVTSSSPLAPCFYGSEGTAQRQEDSSRFCKQILQRRARLHHSDNNSYCTVCNSIFRVR